MKRPWYILGVALIVGQVALSLGLAVAAGCFLRFQYDRRVFSSTANKGARPSSGARCD